MKQLVPGPSVFSEAPENRNDFCTEGLLSGNEAANHFLKPLIEFWMKPNFTKFHYQILLVFTFLSLGSVSGYAHSGTPYLDKYKEGMRMLYPIRTMLFGDTGAVKVKAGTSDKLVDGKCYSDIFNYCSGQEIEIEIEAEAGYQNYQWFKDDVAIAGANGAIYVVTEPGSYHFTAEDPETCEAKLCCPYLVKREAAFDALITKTDANCALGNSGSITVTPDAGEAKDYFYSLNGAPYQQSNVFSNLSGGTYTVSIKSAAGCIVEKTVEIVQPSGIKAIAKTECVNDTTHAIVSVTGGVAPYLFSLDGAAFTADSSFHALSEGQHEVIVKDANGCTYKVIVDAFCECTPEIFEYCPGDSISILAEAAPDQGNYQWFRNGEAIAGATESTYTITAPGNYHYTSGGDDTCEGELCCPIIVREKEVPVLQVSGGELSCHVSSLQLSSGADPSYAHVWSGPNGFSATTASITVTEPGAYTVSVTGPSGCSVSDTATVTQDSVQPTVAVNSGELNCNVSQIILKAEASAGVSYAWAGPNGFTAATESVDATAPGSYVITVTGANGCIARDTALVTENKILPTVAVNGGELNCITTTLDLKAVASAGVAYQWSGPEAFNATTADVSVSIPGMYRVTVTAENGCTAVDSAVVTENKVLPTVSVKGAELNCTITQVELKAEASPGVTYAWSGPEGFNANTANIQTSTAGTYIVTVTSANGCTALDTALVTENKVLPTVTVNGGELNCTLTSLELNAEASAGVSFAWTGPNGFTSTNATVQATLPGQYIVTVKGANGCMASDTATVTENKVLPTVVVQGGEINCTVEQITLQPVTSEGVSFAWSGPAGFTSTDANIEVRAAGQYILTVTAANGCIAKDTAVVTENKIVPTVTVQGGELNCDVTELELTASASAGVTYAWSGPNGFQASTEKVKVTAPGTYIVQVMSANGCIALDSAIVTENKVLPTVTVAGGELNCTVSSLNLKAEASAGARFSWTGPNGFTASTANVTAVEAGNYIVTVTAANGCVASDTAVVTENKVLPTVAVQGAELTCTVPAAGLKAIASAGVSFLWSGPAGFTSTADSINVNTAGTYIVTVTSANGCIAKDTAVVTENKILPVVAVKGGELNCEVTALPLKASGSAGVTYAWTGPEGFTALTDSVQVSKAGIYSVTVTAANGCTATDTAVVTENKVLPTVTLKGGELNCEFSVITLKPQASAGVSFAWTGPNGFSANSNTVEARLPGTYYITVKGANGCTATDSAVVTENKVLPVVAVQGGELNCKVSTLTLTAQGTAGAAFAWAGPNGYTNAGSSIQVTEPGMYTVTASTANGCTAVDTAIVTLNRTLPTVTLNSLELTCTKKTGLLIAKGSEGALYAWTGPNGFTANTDTIEVSAAGEYIVTVTSANGCTASAKTTVKLIEAPTLVAAASCVNNQGKVTLIAAGGVGPYTYSKDGVTFQEMAVFTGLGNGNFIFTVKDANGCITTVTVAVKCEIECVPQIYTFCEGEAIEVTIEADEDLVNYQWYRNGEIIVGAVGREFTATEPGRYYYTAGTGDQCDGILCCPIEIKRFPGMVALATAGKLDCTNGPLVPVTVTVTGGTAPFAYSQDGVNYVTANLFMVGPGSHKFFVKDANGCVIQTNAVVVPQIEMPKAPILTVDKNTVCGTELATLTAACAIGEVIQWNNGMIGGTIQVGEGTYTAVCTNECGSSTASVAVTIRKGELPKVPEVGTDKTLLCGNELATLQAHCTVGDVVEWSNGMYGQTIQVPAGMYTARCKNTCGYSGDSRHLVITKGKVPGSPEIGTDKYMVCGDEKATLVAQCEVGSIVVWSHGVSGTTIQVGEGIYTANCKNDCGISEESRHITVNKGKVPEPPVIAANKVLICGTEKATLTATCPVGTTTKWNTGAEGLSIEVGEGIYSAVCTDICGSSAVSNKIVISKDKAPAAPSIATDKNTICGEEKAILTGRCDTGALIWSTGQVGSPIEVGKGTYTAKCVSECGTSSTSTPITISTGGTPAKPIVTADKTTVCGEEKVKLTAFCTSGTVSWIGVQGFNTTVMVGTGIYAAKCVNECGSSVASEPVTITTGPTPLKPIIASNITAVCGTEKAILTGNCPQGGDLVWSNGLRGNQIQVGIGFYTARCENACGISAASNTITIETGGTPTAPRITANRQAICGDEKVTLTGVCSTGGVLTWSNGMTGSPIMVGTGTYTATCVNTCGSSPISNTLTIVPGVDPGKPVISTNKATVCGAELATLTGACTAGGSLRWSNGMTALQIQVSAGTYYATCVNDCGTSQASEPIVIVPGEVPVKPVVNASKTALCDGELATLTATCTTGTVLWSNGSTGSPIQVGRGTYTAYCKNDCGVSAASETIKIDTGLVPTKPSITANKTAVCGEDKAVLTGICSTGGTLTWSNGATGNIILVPAGTYYAVCKNTCGISASSETITIGDGELPSTPVITASATSVCASEKVTLTATCTSGTVEWITGATTPSIQVGAGSYSAVCVSPCGRSVSSRTVVIDPQGKPGTPVLTPSKTTVCGAEMAVITGACPTGGTLQWTGGQVGNTITVGEGTYTAVCKNECGVSATPAKVVITRVPQAEKPRLVADKTSICGIEKATLTATCTVGTVLWSDGSIENPRQVGQGTYTATCVSECGNSVASLPVVITQTPGPVAPTVNTNKTSVCGTEKATLTGSCTGGGTLTWSHGASGSPIMVGAGTYTAVCVSACGSSASSTPITITTGDKPNAPFVTTNKTSICGTELATIAANCASGNVQWSDGSNVNPRTVGAGTYFAFCTTACGVSLESNKVTIIEQPQPSAPSISTDKFSVCGVEKATLTAICASGTTVVWNTGATTSSISVGAGTYTATCSSTCGSSPAAQPIVISTGNTPSAPVITPSATQVCGTDKVTLTANCTSGTVLWSDGSTSNPRTVGAGTYTAACKTDCGLSSNAVPVVITPGVVPTTPVVNVNKTTLCDGEKATLTASCTSGSLLWNDGSTLPSRTVGVGTYSAICMTTCGSSPASAVVEVKQGPVPTKPTVRSNKDIVCGTEKATLTGSCPTGGTLTWSNGMTGSPIMVASGTYTAICKNTCGSSETSVTLEVKDGSKPQMPVITPSKSVLCGEEKAVLTASGCAGGTLQWSTGASGTSITVGAGTYTVLCVTNCGTSDRSLAVTITKNEMPANFTIATSKAVVCGTEKAILTATGCEGGNITWSNGATGTSIQVGAGTYSAICKIECGGSVNAGPITIRQEELPIKPAVTTDKNSVCGTDKATLTASGCNGTITWYRPGDNGGVQVGTGATLAVSAGTYYATCTTNCGKSDASTPVTIGSGDKPNAPSIQADRLAVCETEKATLTASGCAGTLNWSNGATGTSIQVGKGTYSVTCTTACGTSAASQSVTIGTTNKPAAPAVTADKLKVCGDEKATLTASGCAGTVNWSNGATGSSIQVGPGTYTATCTTSCGTSGASIAVTIGTSEKPLAPAVSADKLTVCGDEKATVTATGCSGILNWSNGATGNSIQVGAGTYSVTCTTACGTSAASATVTVRPSDKPAAPSIRANKTLVCGTETATLTASGCTGTVNWSNGATGNTISVGAGTYTAVCTSTCGNSAASNSITIGTSELPSAPQVSTDKATVCGTEKATLTATGCNGGTLRWSTGQTVSSIQVGAGSYTVTCTTACGTSAASATVTIGTSDKPAAPAVSANKTKVCADEKATLTASGCAGTVSWSNGQNVSVIQVGVGTYTATCTTACGTSVASASISIGTSDRPDAPQVSANKATVCDNEKATVTATGCAGTIKWSNGATGATVVVGAGTYTATCTTACGTSLASASVTVGTSDKPAAPALSTNKLTVCGDEKATLTAAGCAGTLTWSNGASGTSIQVGAGTYTATCSTGCGISDASAAISIGTSEKPAAPQISADRTAVCADEVVTLTASGCAGTITWSNGASGNSIQAGAGTYTATCSSACGVSEASAPVQIGTSDRPTRPVLSSTGMAVCGEQKVTLTASGCAGTLTWSNGATGNSILVGAGTYTATCTTSCGTSEPSSIQINEGGSPEPPVVIADRTSVCGSEKATLTASGCVGGTIHWSTGETGFSIQVTSGVYTATCKDACGNESIACIAIEIDNTAEVPGVPTIAASTDGVCGDEKATLTATGCAGGTIIWSNGATGNSIEVSAGTYSAVCKTSCGESASSGSVVIAAKGGSISISSDKASYCAGETVTLTASGCTNGIVKWSNGATGNVLTMTASSTTTVTAICSNGGEVSTCDFTVGDVEFSAEVPANPNGMHTRFLLTDASYQILQVKNTPKFENVQEGEYKVITLVYIGEIQGLQAGANYSNVSKGACFSDEETEISVCNPVPVNECEAVGSFHLKVKSAIECGGTGDECDKVPTVVSSVGASTCIGTKVVLTAQNCDAQVVWSNGQTGASIQFTAEAVGNQTYSAKCVNAAAGCESEFSAPLTVSITNALPKPMAIETLNNICPLAYVDLRNAILGEAGNGNVFEFRYGNTAASPLVTSAQVTAGVYYLFERSASGCYSEPTAVSVVISDNCTNPIYPNAVDVAIKKIGDKETAVINDDVTYTVTVSNVGANGASQIKVRDIVPQGLQVVEVSENAFLQNGQVHVSIDTLAPGNSVDVSYTAKVMMNGRIANKAELVSVAQNDTNNANNTSTWVINNRAVADSLIGLAKAVGTITKEEGNRYRVPFVFTIANMGLNNLSNISLRDTLALTFGTAAQIDSVELNADPGLTVNPAFTGAGELTDLLIPAQSSIANGQTLNVRMNVWVNLGNNTNVNFSNSATVYADSLSDRSTDGVNPDPDNDGNPGNNSTPTRFTIGEGTPEYGIGAALAVVDSAFVNGGNAYEVTYRVKIKNFGPDTLSHVYVTDSLLVTFAKATEFNVSGKPTVTSGSTLVVNPDFDGKEDLRLLLPDSSATLAPGQTDSLDFKVTLVFGTYTGPYSSNATAFGIDKDSLLTDVSNAGFVILPHLSTPTVFNVPESLDPRDLVDIPEGFSPNGDGKNDNWKIELKGNAKIEKLQIVNRYGATLYEEDGENVSTGGWDGKANTGLIPGNGSVPAGTYFYKLKLAGQNKYIIDYITVEK